MKCESCGKVKRGRPHPTNRCKDCRKEVTEQAPVAENKPEAIAQ